MERNALGDMVKDGEGRWRKGKKVKERAEKVKVRFQRLSFENYEKSSRSELVFGAGFWCLHRESFFFVPVKTIHS